MKPKWLPLLTIAALVAASGCAHHSDLQKSSAQDDFGVQMAKMNLWREAMFRFQRAVEINPDDAMARNNLAVAYEANGDFEKARKEYLEALRLDRSNQYIQKNYSRFVEFLSRNRKREPKASEAAALKVPPGATSAQLASSSAPAAPVAGGTASPAVAVTPQAAPQPEAPPPLIAPPTAVNPTPTPPPPPPPGGKQ